MNRESSLAAFDRAVDSMRRRHQILNFTGVGGIGKSRLLQEVQGRLPATIPSALLDLQVPGLREPQDALATLRSQFGRQGIAFTRFDIAYAVLWQRLHPRLALSREGPDFVASSEVLTAVFDQATGVPVFGSAAKLLDRAARAAKRWNSIRHDETLQELDSLSLPQLSDAVTYLFASDIMQFDRPAVLFIDAYEALVAGAFRTGRTAAVDAWLRDLAWQLSRGLVVVGSRERLDWQRYDPEWAQIIDHVAIEGLPLSARLELLQAIGVHDEDLSRSIARGSAGLPFFLHLARDSGDVKGSVVSPAAILERFLQHVDPADVRTLELLSVARLFNEPVFKSLAASYNLPSHRLAWESLVSYSFVLRAGAGNMRLHQLMAQAMCTRLTSNAMDETHRLLSRAWNDVYAGATGAIAAIALRESAYHAVRAGTADADAILTYADRIKAVSAASGIEGLVADLEEFTSEQVRPDLKILITCLQAEALVLHGDAESASHLTETIPLETPDDEVRARLQLAAAHARRIIGDTAEALRRYEAIWTGYEGPCGIVAGLWAADLNMAQGRIAPALQLSQDILAALGPDNHEQRAEAERLMHLACRFGFDFGESEHHLQRAKAEYERVASVVGLADIGTNEIELWALIAPRRALQRGSEVLTEQERLEADHELGKVHSALALAAISLGHLDDAESSLDAATAAFNRASYRSGQARASLYRAALSVRRGNPADALKHLRWSVRELEAAEVYPTLIVTAVRLAERLGILDVALEASCRRALGQIKISYPLNELELRIAHTLDRVLGNDLSALFAEANEQQTPAAGFYNVNVRVGQLLVRMPIPEADSMDLTIWPEPAVVAAVHRHVGRTPRLLAYSHEPRFQVHTYIEGAVLDDVSPRGTALPPGVTEQICAFARSLRAVPLSALPPLPGDWPRDGDTQGFAHRLIAMTSAVIERFRPQYGGLWDALGFPRDPLATLDVSALTPRRFTLIHADLHRRNMILTPAGVHFLDWELALWGDPVYELVENLHKMAYLPDEESLILRDWFAGEPELQSIDADLDTYLAHERVKSAVVDSVRYHKLLQDPDLGPVRREVLLIKLASKVEAAAGVWGRPDVIDLAAIEQVLATRRW